MMMAAGVVPFFVFGFNDDDDNYDDDDDDDGYYLKYCIVFEYLSQLGNLLDGAL